MNKILRDGLIGVAVLWVGIFIIAAGMLLVSWGGPVASIVIVAVTLSIMAFVLGAA